MSTRKTKEVPRTYDAYRDVAPPPPRPQKKASRRPRVHLTHFEVRRGDRLRLRIAVADDALAEVGEELGALVKKIAPSTQTTVIPTPIDPDDFVVSPQHNNDDATYHARLREHLTALIDSLCDESLADALEIAREERARRAEGGN
jgi:hypothetical protein